MYLSGGNAPVFASAPAVGTKGGDAEGIIHNKVKMEFLLQLENLREGSDVAIVVIKPLDDDKLTVDFLLLRSVVLFYLFENAPQIFGVVVLEIK